MSYLNFGILAFSNNFCPIKTDLPGNTVWPQASGFPKLAKMDHFWHFQLTFVTQNVNVARNVNETFSVIFKHRGHGLFISFVGLLSMADFCFSGCDDVAWGFSSSIIPVIHQLQDWRGAIQILYPPKKCVVSYIQGGTKILHSRKKWQFSGHKDKLPQVGIEPGTSVLRNSLTPNLTKLQLT